MAGGWFKRGWEPGLTTLDEWWFWSTQYIYDDGTTKLPAEYPEWTRAVADFTRNVAKQDPSPFWKFGRLIEEHAKLRPRISQMPVTVSLDDLWWAAETSYQLKDLLWSMGTTNKRAGRPKSETTKRVEKLLSEKLETDPITERVKTSAANVRQIRHRTKRKT